MFQENMEKYLIYENWVRHFISNLPLSKSVLCDKLFTEYL